MCSPENYQDGEGANMTSCINRQESGDVANRGPALHLEQVLGRKLLSRNGLEIHTGYHSGAVL